MWGKYGIRPNHSERIPQYHVTVDCESLPREGPPGLQYETHRLRLWCASAFRIRKGQIDRRETTQGFTADQFWAWLWGKTNSHHPVWVWAHNAKVDFTWLGLWQQLDLDEWSYKMGVLDSPPFIVWANWRDRRVCFCDSLNWWRTSLEEVGQSVGVAKQTMPDFSASDAHWMDYCHNDVRVLTAAVEGIVSYVTSGNHGQLRHTVSGQAWNSWRHSKPAKLPRFHNRPDVSELERVSYRGGRCQVHYRGKVSGAEPTYAQEKRLRSKEDAIIFADQVEIYDARSFFPAIMHRYKFPWNLERELGSISVDHLARLVSHRSVIATVLIETDRVPYPCWHHQERQYCTGRFVSTLCTPELSQALSSNSVKAVYHVLDYDTADLFSPWIEAHWRRREEFHRQGLRAWEQLEKTLGNSLYGYFGRRDHEWVQVPDWPVRQRWGDWLELFNLAEIAHRLPAKVLARLQARYKTDQDVLWRLRAVAGVPHLRCEAGEWPQAVVSIPAHVTSHGRVMIQEWTDLLPNKTCVYSHTDSLHLLRNGVKHLQLLGLVSDTEPGKLRYHAGPADANYLARQVYQFGGKWVMAGLSRAGHWTSEDEYEYPKWDEIAEIFNRPMDSTINVKRLSAHLAAWQPPGKRDKDGWVTPPCIDSDERESEAVPF